MANREASATAKVKCLEAFLDKAKPQYAEAYFSGTWPANVNGVEFEQEQLQSVIMSIHSTCERERKRSHIYRDMVSKAGAMDRKLTENLDAVVEFDLDLALGQEMAAAANPLVDLTNLAKRGLEIMATADAPQQEIEGLLDQVLDSPTPQGGVDEATFESIMAGYFYDLSPIHEDLPGEKPQSRGAQDDWRFLRLLPCQHQRVKSEPIPHAIPRQ